MLCEFVGGGMIMLLFSVCDFENFDLLCIIEKMQKLLVCLFEDCVKFFKFVWDVVGFEFVLCYNQYELFYVGVLFVMKGYVYCMYDWQCVLYLVDLMFGSYLLNQELLMLCVV